MFIVVPPTTDCVTVYLGIEEEIQFFVVLEGGWFAGGEAAARRQHIHGRGNLPHQGGRLRFEKPPQSRCF